MKKHRFTPKQKALLAAIEAGNGSARISDKAYASIRRMSDPGFLRYCWCGYTITISRPSIDPQPLHMLALAREELEQKLTHLTWVNPGKIAASIAAYYGLTVEALT